MMTSKATEPEDRRISKRVVAGLVVVAAALLATAYVWRTQASRSAPPLQHVRIANTAYAGTCPVLVAREQGYFTDEGLNATLQSYTTGKAALDATLHGAADLGTSAELPIVFAATKGLPVSVIATISAAERDYGIVGRRDRGLAVPASLKGMRIGVTLNTSGQFVLDAFLNRQRLSSDDVEMRDLKPEELAGAMAEGQIDAASTWEPYLRVLREQLGENAATFSAGEVYDSLYSISGTRDYVANHPEIVEKVLRALVRGAQYCRQRPGEASDIVAESLQADAAKLKDLWSSYRFAVSLDQGLLLALEDQTRWAIKNKLTEGAGMPNYLDHLYLEGLQAVAPASLTVMH